MPKLVNDRLGGTIGLCLTALVTVGGFSVSHAQGPALFGTQSVVAQPVLSGGSLLGCSLIFDAIAQDWIYKQGGIIAVNGSVSFMKSQGKLAVTLKVVLNDFDTAAGKFVPDTPASAYFVSGNATTKASVVASTPSDVPGGIFVVFQPDPTFSIVTDALISGQVTIAFARKQHATDIILPVATNVIATSANGERTYSFKPTLEFTECAKTLLGAR